MKKIYNFDFMLNNYFDHIYCINLDRRKDRWDRMVHRFEKFGLTVERVPAIDGNTLKNIDSKLRSGEIGCSLSHVYCLEDMIAKNYKNAVILEDDIEFKPEWRESLPLTMQVLPGDFKMLYFGAKHVVAPDAIGKWLYKVNKAYTTSSYAITQEYAKIILPQIKLLQKQVDVVYAENHNQGRIYATRPCLIWQREDTSDIQGGSKVNVEHYFKLY